MSEETERLRKKLKDLEIENNQIRWTSAANTLNHFFNQAWDNSSW